LTGTNTIANIAQLSATMKMFYNATAGTCLIVLSIAVFNFSIW